MQQKRGQFSLEIVHCDGFTSMPATAQALYLQILSVCDDEGFTSQLGMCKFMAHATDEDVQTLVNKEFIYLVGERKVCVVKHWLMNTWLRRKNSTTFEERSLVYVKANGNYTLDGNDGTALALYNNSTTAAQQQSSRGDTPTRTATQPSNPIQSNPNTYQSNTSKRVTSKQRTREEDEVEVMDLYNHEDHINEILEKSKDEEMF